MVPHSAERRAKPSRFLVSSAESNTLPPLPRPPPPSSPVPEEQFVRTQRSHPECEHGESTWSHSSPRSLFLRRRKAREAMSNSDGYEVYWVWATTADLSPKPRGEANPTRPWHKRSGGRGMLEPA